AGSGGLDTGHVGEGRATRERIAGDQHAGEMDGVIGIGVKVEGGGSEGVEGAASGVEEDEGAVLVVGEALTTKEPIGGDRAGRERLRRDEDGANSPGRGRGPRIARARGEREP